MEHRHDARKRLVQRIRLETPRIGAITVVSRDVSLGGMFIEPNPAFLPLHSQAAVSFSLSRGTSRYSFTLPAMVVRVADNGAGLMFLDLENETIRTLGSVLSSPVMLVDAFDTAPDVFTAPRHADNKGHGTFR